MQSQAPGKPAVFLDRDGTVVEDADYLVDPEQLRLIPGAAAALRRLNQAGMTTVVVTNQSIIARGLATEQQLAAVHDRLQALLAPAQARLDGVYYCPHHPEIGAAPYRQACDCRKPKPGLLLHAARDLAIDLAASTMIGDSLRDLEAGAAAGCGTLILVRTGHGAAEEAQAKAAKLNRPIMICKDLGAAIDHLLSSGVPTEKHAPPRPIAVGRQPAASK